MRVVSLKALAKTRKVKGYSKMKKAELLKVLKIPSSKKSKSKKASKKKTKTVKKTKTLKKTKTATKKTKTKTVLGVAKPRKTKLTQLKIIRKKKRILLAKEKKEEEKEREERRMDTPLREDRMRNFFKRVSNFIIDMNSTNQKKVVFAKYGDIKPFLKYVMDEENELDITSKDYLKFKESGKKKKTKISYVDMLELLQDLDDYKKEKALLHLYNFIEKYSEYEDLILNIIDKELPLKKGPITSIEKIIKKEEKIEKKESEDTKEILTEVEKMVFQINKTNKTTEKKEILKSFNHLKRLIKYVYDPDIVFGVKSKAYLKFESNDKKVKHEVYEKYTDLYKLLDDLSERKITGNTALINIYHFINLHKVHKQIILNIIDKSLKIRLNKAAISDIFPKLFSTFEPVLANKFKQSILDKTKEDWYITRKLDGVRCLIIIDIEKQKVSVYSRTGKKLLTLGVLEDAVLDHIHEFDQSYVLDGEVIVESDQGVESFKQLMEQIKKKNYTIPNPEYRVFDIIPISVFGGVEKGKVLMDRYKDILKYFGGGRINNIRALKQQRFTQNKFEKLKNKATNENWEGLMVRRDTYYKGKRTNDLLKYKTFLDDEFIVLGMEEGVKGILNKRTGKVEQRRVMAAVYINYNNTKVGSGFSDEERLYFIDHPEKIIGKVITVQYFEKTEESLRFPTFKILHGDKRNT